MSETIIDLSSHLNLSNNDNLLWSYNDKIDIYNKHTQYVNNHENNKINDIKSIEKNIDINDTISDTKNNIISNKLSSPDSNNDSKELLRPSLSKLLKEEKKHKKKEVVQIITPLELIMRESNSHEISKDDIKESIINLISRNDYIKVFGKKKSADTMSAFINNKWNKSIIQFVSFLFDKKIIYNKNEIVYQKNEGTIII